MVVDLDSPLALAANPSGVSPSVEFNSGNDSLPTKNEPISIFFFFLHFSFGISSVRYARFVGVCLVYAVSGFRARHPPHITQIGRPPVSC